jgi:hypothetical protein
VPIGDLSGRGDENTVHEEKKVLSGLLDVSQAAGEGILGTVYTRRTPPLRLDTSALGRPGAAPYTAARWRAASTFTT